MQKGLRSWSPKNEWGGSELQNVAKQFWKSHVKNWAKRLTEYEGVYGKQFDLENVWIEKDE